MASSVTAGSTSAQRGALIDQLKLTETLAHTEDTVYGQVVYVNNIGQTTSVVQSYSLVTAGVNTTSNLDQETQSLVQAWSGIIDALSGV